MPLSHWYIFL